MLFFFFFQAEDGIRDIGVTGVQTCALPISLKALERSHLVLVPTQSSLPDVRDAVKTIAQIDDAEELARTPIARAVVWTRFLPGFESRVARHVRQSLEGQG